MAVENTGITLPSATDINNLLSNIDLKTIMGKTMAETTGIGVGGAVLGSVLLGALLPRLLGTGLETTAAAAALAPKPLDASDVQNIVTGSQNSAMLGAVQGEIWKAEGNVQTAISAAANVGQIATLNAEIANLQGQTGVTKSITDSASALSADFTASQIASLQGQGIIVKAVNEAAITNQAGAANIVTAVNSTSYQTAQAIAASTAANLATTNALASQAAQNAAQANAAILENKFAISQVVAADGNLTRTAIAALQASIPNARELDLQRQLTVALDDHRHTWTRGHIDAGNTTVTTNVNQAQAQAQQQQQQVTMNGLLGQLIAAQHATNTSIINGNGNRPNQTATNVGG
jgi:hypothetical protein